MNIRDRGLGKPDFHNRKLLPPDGGAVYGINNVPTFQPEEVVLL